MKYQKQDLQAGASDQLIEEIESYFEILLPGELKAILQESNGITLYTEEKEIQVLGTDGMIEGFLEYQFPQYLPDAVPLAMDGCGNFIILKKGGSSTVFGVSAGNLCWEDAVVLGEDFKEFLQDPTSSDDRIHLD